MHFLTTEVFMKAHKKKRKAQGGKVAATPKRRLPVLWIALIVAGIAMAAIMVLYQRQQTGPDPVVVSTPVKSNSRVAAASKSDDSFQNLIGDWLRPDGGYVIEIRKIGSGGRLDAYYFNPRPINVSQAEVAWKEDAMQVTIELRDTGYPGSTYTLIYNSQQDMLTGIYYQAAVNQSFEVVFVRKK